MSAPGMWEIIFLAVLALLIFGPDKLPGMARSVGQTINTFKREAQSTMDELKRSADLQELRDVAGELRGTTADLKRSAALTGPVASAAGATDVAGAADAGQDSPVRADLPAPFDPDAT
jgi:sec-independent protein translocase protein TatB